MQDGSHTAIIAAFFANLRIAVSKFAGFPTTSVVYIEPDIRRLHQA